MKICLNISSKKIAVLLLFIWFLPLTANATHILNEHQESNEGFLAMAESAYYDEDFNAAIKYANLYLGQANLTNKNKQTAYILLTHIYLALNDLAVAEQSVNNVLDINPSYSATLETETPQYVTFVAKVKKKYLSKSKPVILPAAKRSNQNFTWYIWGGAGVAVAALTLFLLADSDSDTKGKPLSLPPQFPE